MYSSSVLSTQVAPDPSPESIPEPTPEPNTNWHPKATYIGGDQINHKGKAWTAKWWTRGEEPGTTGEWGVWR